MKHCLEKLLLLTLWIKLTTSYIFFIVKSFVTPALRHLFCNTLIQPHFDYACSAWYPNLIKKIKHKIHTTQNKCKYFRLQLDKSDMPPHAKREYRKKLIRNSERMKHLRAGGFRGMLWATPLQWVQSRALVGVQGTKPSENFAFLILKIP